MIQIKQIADFRRFILLALLFVMTIVYSFAEANKDNYGIKNVLYISSNHDTYFPSSEILSGATNYFREHQQKIDLKTIYLNSRYVQNRDLWRGTIVTEMNKLIDKQIDLLIVAGPEAISVIDTLDDPRLRNAPVIYCGTISLKDVKRPNIAGILLNYRYDEVVTIAEKLYPNLENIYLIGDQGTYSAQLVQIAQQQLNRFTYKYNIIVNTDLGAVNDVLIFLKSLPENSFVVMLNWQRTLTGDFCDWTIYYPLFAQNCTSPMYRHVKDLLKEEYAIAPNRFLYQHGQEVGAMGLQLLKGTPGAQMPIKSPKITWAVSQNWLTKEQIEPRNLPENVTIISDKIDKISQNSLFISLCIVLSIPLFIMAAQLIFKRKKNKINARSIEILQNEVSNVLMQFENEHAILDGFLNSIRDGALIIEIGTNRILNTNPQMANLLNLELKEVLGKKIEEVMSMRQGEIAVDIHGYIRSVMTTGVDIDFTTNEVYIVCRNGKRVQCNGSFSLLQKHNAQLDEACAVLLTMHNIESSQQDQERINTTLRSLHVTTWSFDVNSRSIVFKEGEDPLSRSLGSVHTIDTIALFVIENQRRDFHAFWTDLVRSNQTNLRFETLLDFSGSGKYEPWAFVGYSKSGKTPSETQIFGSMSKIPSQSLEPTIKETCPEEPLSDNNPENNQQEIVNTDHKATLLIAEDNDSNYLLISKLLKNKYNLFRAKNGEQAIVIAEKEKPCLILMDMNMPVLDGATATQIIRSTDQSTPIYALTASVYDSDKLKTIKAGCTGYLSKPVDKEALFAVLKKHCGY